MMTFQIALASALLAPAQADPTGPTSALRAVSPRPVDEQIEVMRALLVRRLGRSGIAQPLGVFGESHNFYQPQLTGNFTGGFGGGTRTVGMSFEPTVEGAYLDGYGAVFTVALPAFARDPRAGEGASKESPALSEWDREQRQLRGEPLPEKATAPKTPSVSDTLLKLLAENGKHFTALKDDERVTVAVTFRGTGPQAVTFTGSHLAGDAVHADATLSGNVVREDRVATLENIGALHLKQGEPQRAIDAFGKAAALAEDELKSEANAPPDGSAPRDRAYESLAKLAQAYLAAGKMDEARETMDRAKSVREKRATAANKSPQTGKLIQPARLTISATKKLLDQVGSGKITADEFRKQATVEYIAAARAETNKP